MELAVLEATSQPFLGQWQQLISTTNWDKGRIIHDWRTALIAAGAEAADYADEVWSRQVGGVTPQHVGRLRRVYDRFGAVRESYAGLYWSHFQAGLDWSDAEMWLEGAVQNEWSIAEMRRQRWETLAGSAELNPQDEEVVASELDEDAEPLDGDGLEATYDGKVDVVRPARKVHDSETAEASWSDVNDADGADYSGEPDYGAHEGSSVTEPVRPFAHLASLPADVSDAFESFKLCILKHKLAGWTELAREDLLAALDALKHLALTASDA